MLVKFYTHLPLAFAVAAAIVCRELWAGAADDSVSAAAARDTSSRNVSAANGAPADTSSKTTAAAAAVSDSATARTAPEKPKEPVLLIKTKRDTVIMIADENEVHKILHTLSTNVKKSRLQGYGGAGGFSRRIVAFDMEPVVDLMRYDTKLAGITFPSLKGGFSPLNMNGGLGYGGLGHGIRIGGGGYGGSRKYVSQPFKRTPASPDSTMSLMMEVSFGGLLVEKALVKENWNVYMGSFIGAGGINIEKTTSPTSNASAFSSSGGTNERATAGFMSMEFHGGATYTIVPWMHIGGDCNALCYFSANGFELAAGNSIYGIAPGFGFRIIFGNIG